MENVNKQLLDALKSIRYSMQQGRMLGNDYRREMKNSEELATTVIAAAEQAQQRCQYCDGTGDVHSPTGEWRGVCKCEAGQQAQQAEPVAWVKQDVLTTLKENEVCYAFGAQDKKGRLIPLYTSEPVARDVLMAALHELRDACSFAVSGDIGVKSADKIMAGVDIAAIADRYAAQPPAVAVPDGYALVPIEPTKAMCEAGDRADADMLTVQLIYRAMIDAALKT